MRKTITNRIISVFMSTIVSIALIFFYTPNAKTEAAIQITESDVVSSLLAKVGDYYSPDRCLAFVDDYWESMGGERSGKCCAHTAAEAIIQSSSIDNIPIGADVFFENASGWKCEECSNIPGHIGIYIGDNHMIDAANGSIRKVPLSYFNSGNWRYIGWGYHPNISIIHSQIKWYDNYTPVNLGEEFYAQVICQDNGCYLSNLEGNVVGADPIATDNQIWHFVRQSDGSYAILSYYDDYSMDVYAASTDNATNIQMMPYVGNTAQKFMIYSINGAYYIRSQCNEYPFTINRQNKNNLELWFFDPTFTNKRFDIIKLDLDGNMPISIGGDFYAQMICEYDDCYLSNMEGNVGGAEPIGTKNQIWHFKWLNDGSYSITSYYDGLSMDVAGAKTDNATNMQMMPYVGNTAQKFMIYSINGAYYIRSQCNEYPFTINGQNNDNLELWFYDPTFINKRFSIIEVTPKSIVTGECNDNDVFNSVKGDANCDGTTDMADVILIMQALANPNKYGENGTAEVHLTAQGKANADMDGNGLTVGDAQAIQKILLALE